jgi:RNA-directed DNA polymerase
MQDTAQVMTGAASVNGPEDEALDWHGIDWAECEDNVRRIRQRIFTATQAGDLNKVRNLQKLMLRSRSNTLVSVKRVTQQSSGRETAGIDGELALTPAARGKLAAEIHRSSQPWKATPVKRVFIPKSNGKQRPLGIPVIRDRVLQARVKNALEPEWEARFEPRSYGFRPGRGCQDAIASIFWTAKGKDPKRLWVLDADLSAAFDRIDHNHLMTSIGQFPARDLIRGWLVRYADDFVVLCHDEAVVHQVRARLEEWLEPRGLSFNEQKTKVAHLSQGFDFLGFTVRRTGGKLIIKPSTAACQRLRARLRAEVKSLHGANAEAVLRRLVPIVRGWTAYYRMVASTTTFSSLDHYMWQLTFKWARRSHRKKSRHWVVDRYFGRFNPSRRDRWVFGDRDSGAYLPKFSWIGIVRHQLVKGGASIDDPALNGYWRDRRRKTAPPPMDKTSFSLALRQKGLCPLCKQALIAGAEYEPDNPRAWIEWFAASKKMLHRHHLTYRRDGGTDERTNLRLVHSACHRQHHAGDGKRTTPSRPAKPSGFA